MLYITLPQYLSYFQILFQRMQKLIKISIFKNRCICITLYYLIWAQYFAKIRSQLQFTSLAQSRLTLCKPWITAHQASLSITNSQSLLKLMPIESVMSSNHLILCRPLLLLPPIPPRIRVFSSESTLLMRWPKYWSFSFSISPSNQLPGLISFRMDWLALLVV